MKCLAFGAGAGMGKYRDHRQPRSHGFESDNYLESPEPRFFDSRPTPQASPSVSTSQAQDAEVLWLNVGKGFGFLKLSDGSDAFIHLSKLQAVGHSELPAGTHLKVRTEPGQKGLQVVEVLSVSFGSNDQVARGISPPAGSLAPQRKDLGDQQGVGVVKRFDMTKGFGFIGLNGGGKDVFVHVTTLTRNGLSGLEVGQNVDITYSQGQKGLEVKTIRLS